MTKHEQVARGRMLTDREVAERLACSERTVRRLRVERRLGSVRIGRLVRVPESELDAYIERCSRPALHVESVGDRVVLRAVPLPGSRPDARARIVEATNE